MAADPVWGKVPSRLATPKTHNTSRGEEQKGGSVMAKFHARPSNQYRYEHYDPRF